MELNKITNEEQMIALAAQMGFSLEYKHAPHSAHIGTWDRLAKNSPEYTKEGKLKKKIKPFTTRANVVMILESDPEYRTLCYDEHSDKILLKGEMVSDSTLEQIALDLEVNYLLKYTSDNLRRLVIMVANRNKIEPIKDWLLGLEWDGKPRIEELMADAFKAEIPSGMEGLVRSISKAWVISCVARILEPGSKVDTCIVLVGSKGLRKSTALKALTGAEWFSDSHINVGHKDAYELIHQTGVWIWELAEMHSLHGKSADNAKQFLSSFSDTYRPAYGKMPVSRKRRTVFVASTNNFQFLSDGPERRFWPIKITSQIDLAYIEENRSQIWAEAVHYFQAGADWWLDWEMDRTLAEYQQAYIIDDPWAIPVMECIQKTGRPTTTEIMNYLELPPAQQHSGNSRRIAQICRDYGCEQVIENKKRVWRRKE